MNITEICNKAQGLYERLETESPDHFEEIQPDLQDVLDFISKVATKLQDFKADRAECLANHDYEKVSRWDFGDDDNEIYEHSRFEALGHVIREIGGKLS